MFGIAQDSRARLACPRSPGSTAQDYRAHLSAQDHRGYEHHDTEDAAKTNEGPDCFLTTKASPKETGSPCRLLGVDTMEKEKKEEEEKAGPCIYLFFRRSRWKGSL